MVDFGSWAFVIAGGLASVAAVGGLAEAARPTAIRRGNICYLTYGWPVKLLTLTLIPLTLFGIYAMLNASPDLMLVAFPTAMGLVAITGFLVYQIFFVRFGYDRNTVYFDSPFCKNRMASWDGLEEVGHSWFVQADYLVLPGIGRIWCSSLLDGYDELSRFLECKAGTLAVPQS